MVLIDSLAKICIFIYLFRLQTSYFAERASVSARILGRQVSYNFVCAVAGK